MKKIIMLVVAALVAIAASGCRHLEDRLGLPHTNTSNKVAQALLALLLAILATGCSSCWDHTSQSYSSWPGGCRSREYGRVGVGTAVEIHYESLHVSSRPVAVVPGPVYYTSGPVYGWGGGYGYGYSGGYQTSNIRPNNGWFYQGNCSGAQTPNYPSHGNSHGGSQGHGQGSHNR